MIHSDMTFNRQASLISVVQLSRESLLFSDKIIEQTNQLTCVFFKLLSIKFVAEINRNFRKIFRPFFLNSRDQGPKLQNYLQKLIRPEKVKRQKVTFRKNLFKSFSAIHHSCQQRTGFTQVFCLYTTLWSVLHWTNHSFHLTRA